MCRDIHHGAILPLYRSKLPQYFFRFLGYRVIYTALITDGGLHIIVESEQSLGCSNYDVVTTRRSEHGVQRIHDIHDRVRNEVTWGA